MGELDGLLADGSIEAPDGGWAVGVPIRRNPLMHREPDQIPMPPPAFDHGATYIEQITRLLRPESPPKSVHRRMSRAELVAPIPIPPPRQANYEHIAQLEREVLDTLPQQWADEAAAKVTA